MPVPAVEYGSAAAYADAVRNWCKENQAWCSFHQMLAMQAFSIGQQAQSGAAQQPPQAAQPPFIPPRATIITGPDGTRTITATYQVASLMRRLLAELIDCVFTFSIKLILVYLLVDFGDIDLSRYDKILSNQSDLQTLIDLTHELFPVELLSKLVCALLEAVFISYGAGLLHPGLTPGKHFMRIRVISCHSALPVVGDPRSVTVTGSVTVPIYSSVFRAIFKNILVTSLIPVSTIVFFFNHNRSIYDVMSNTIVVSF